MASLAPEEKVEFLLNVLATLPEFKPDYGALAAKTGINTNSNAQRKLKGIVEADKRFVLQSDRNGTKVIDTQDGGEGSQPARVKTPKSRKRTKKSEDGADDEGTPSKKGRKTKAKDDNENEDEGETKDGIKTSENGEEAI
ncbi:hypothetical protein PMZ80_005509 [Knufia obscura]|uniref:Uncharacterized protein n=1 Tax=Knufia obscura TaxID=1635080 RepID=A0ABR0RLS3_9EURO|nr:hypothetical protein PMZ80_005509 [Knufia obscura]